MTVPMLHTAAVDGYQNFVPEETSLASTMSHVVHKMDLKREDLKSIRMFLSSEKKKEEI